MVECFQTSVIWSPLAANSKSGSHLAHAQGDMHAPKQSNRGVSCWNRYLGLIACGNDMRKQHAAG
eukprot:2425590-Pleurochrysis_carterae.AAC.1